MSGNLYLAERDNQRLGIFLFGLGLIGAGLSVQSERALFAATGAPLTEVAALTALVQPTQDQAEEQDGTRVLTIPRAFTGLTRRRLAPRRAAPLVAAPAVPQAIASLTTTPENTGGPATDIPNIGAPEQVGATDIPGIVTNNEAAPQPGAPQGVLEEEEVLIVPGPVPEPSTWLMLIAGFFMMGGALRQSKKPSNAVELPTSN
jgi:hypothetical protein